MCHTQQNSSVSLKATTLSLSHCIEGLSSSRGIVCSEKKATIKTPRTRHDKIKGKRGNTAVIGLLAKAEEAIFITDIAPFSVSIWSKFWWSKILMVENFNGRKLLWSKTFMVENFNGPEFLRSKTIMVQNFDGRKILRSKILMVKNFDGDFEPKKVFF